MNPRLPTLVAFGALAVLSLGAGAANALPGGVAAAVEREDYTAAAALLRADLERVPDDEAARFMLARVLGWAGNYAAAIAEYDALIAQSPGNVDYAFGRAQVLAWDGRDGAALDELGRARALAPSYEAVWRLELAVLERGAGTRERLRAFRQAAARQFPGSDWWQPSVEPQTSNAAMELSIGIRHESLSRPVPDWRSTSIELTRRRADGSVVYGVLREQERFGRRDVGVGAGASFAVAPQWTAGFELEAGDDVDFAPRVAAAGWAARALPGGWETQIRLRQRRYSAAEVTSAAATLGRYFGDFRAAYTFDRARLHGEASSGTHSAALSYFHSERTRFDLTLARGQEAEAIAPGRVLETDVSGISIGGRHGVGERWRVSWWAGSQRQGELYRRRYVGMALAAGL